MRMRPVHWTLTLMAPCGAASSSSAVGSVVMWATSTCTRDVNRNNQSIESHQETDTYKGNRHYLFAKVSSVWRCRRNWFIQRESDNSVMNSNTGGQRVCLWPFCKIVSYDQDVFITIWSSRKTRQNIWRLCPKVMQWELSVICHVHG